jgi:hypothetical protein
MDKRQPTCLRLTRLLILAALLAFLAAPGLTLASDVAAPDALCLEAARSAARETGVPLTVLLALTLTETGRAGPDGELRPWAWALNRGGEGYWFDSREAALSYLEQALADGTVNIDVGCFQLNLRWHGAAFATIEQMIDPATNALYAARHVGELYQRSGDWIAAAAAYHSATPEHAERYLGRFRPIYAALQSGEVEASTSGNPRPAAASDGERVNAFPLLRAGAAATPGSIVPMDGAVLPLIGGS